MENLKKKIVELKNLGFSQEQTQEILLTGEKEVLEKVMEEFTTKSEEDVVQSYVNKVENAKNDDKKLNEIFGEIMTKLYGAQNVENKKEELLMEYVQSIIDITKETKNVLEKHSQNDPQTVKTMEEAQKNPKVQELAKKIQEDKDKGLY